MRPPGAGIGAEPLPTEPQSLQPRRSRFQKTAAPNLIRSCGSSQATHRREAMASSKETTIGAAELAEKLGTGPKELRKFLRAEGETSGRGKRYQFTPQQV